MIFERFTQQAREVIVYAQDEARQLGHDQIGSEHLLLGLLREGEGLAARALEAAGVTFVHARDHVARVVAPGEEKPTTGQIPFTPQAFTRQGNKVLELAACEADSLGHRYVGAEHILLGLVSDEGGVGARVLRKDFDVDLERIRGEVIRMLSGPPGSGRHGPRLEPPRPPAPPASMLSREADVVAGEKQGAIEAHDRERFALLHEREGRLNALEIELRDLHESARAAGREKEVAIEAAEFERAAAARDRERKLKRLDEDAQKRVARLTALRVEKNAAIDAAIAEVERLVGDARREG